MGTDRTHPRILALRLLAEFAIIFVGVVLAFQFEGWRDQRNEEVRETAQLRALASDFERNRAALSRTIRDQAVTTEAVNQWRLALSGRPLSLSLDSLGTMYPYALSWYAEETVSGAWDALLASGDAGLISNSDLRGRLAAFYGWVNGGFEDHDNEMDILLSLIEMSKVELGPLTDPLFTRFGLQPAQSALPPYDTTLVRDLLERPGHWGLITWKWSIAEMRLSRLEWLQASADTISQIIDTELANRNN